MKDKLLTTFKIAISLGLMAYFFYVFFANPSERAVLFESFSQARYLYWVLALGLYLLAVISNAYKWQILLRAQGVPVPIRPLVNYTFVGFFFTNFLPSNVGGDVMRGFGLARYTDRSADAAVSVIVDRIIGLMAFMFTAVIAALATVTLVSNGAIPSLAGNETLVQNLTQVQIGAFIVLFFIAAVFAMMLSARLRHLGEIVFSIKILAPLAPIYHQVSEAFGAYRHQYTALLLAFTIGLANPILTGLVDVAIIAGLNADINPLYVFLFNPIIAVSLILPVSIGGLGAMSALYVYFYGLVGVPSTIAFALSLIKQLVIYIGSLPGAVLWWQGPPSDSTNDVTG
ncbi:MAG: lysylphosphatidylglycerol synthase transmembrane domain-containing protein [Chloroflexota bacterium]